MEATRVLEGHCLCGKVRLKVEGAGDAVGACHCGICRRWSGGPMLAIDTHGAVEIEGAAHVGVYASSDWAERGFCRECGTHLFYRLKDGGLHGLPVGLFGDEGWAFEQQIFIEEKPGFYEFANQTRMLTGEEVFAQAQE